MGQIPAELEARIDGERQILFLATDAGGRPHVVPVWYYYDDGHVQVTTDGAAARNVEQNEHVSAALQADTDGYPDWMASLTGRASLHTEARDVAELTERIYAKYMGSDRSQWRQEEYRETVESPEPDRVVVDLDVDSTTYRMF